MADEAEDAKAGEATTDEVGRRPGLHWMLDEKGEPTALSQLEAIALLLLETKRVAESAASDESTVASLLEQVAKAAKAVHGRELGDNGARVAHAQAVRADKEIRAAVVELEKQRRDRIQAEERHKKERRPGKPTAAPTDERLAKFLAMDLLVNVRRELPHHKVLDLLEKARQAPTTKSMPERFVAMLAARSGDSGVADIMSPTSNRRRSAATLPAQFWRPWSAVPGLVDLALRADEAGAPSKQPKVLAGLRHAIGELVEWFTGAAPEPRGVGAFVEEDRVAELELPAAVLSATSRRLAKRLVYLWRNRETRRDLGLYVEEARRLWTVTHAADHAWARYLSEDRRMRRRETAESTAWDTVFAGPLGVDDGLLLDEEPPVYIEGVWIRALVLPIVLLELRCAEHPSRAAVDAVSALSDDLANTADDAPDLRRFTGHVIDAVGEWDVSALRSRPASRAAIQRSWTGGVFDWYFDPRVQAHAYGEPLGPKESTGSVVARSELAAVLDRKAKILSRGLVIASVEADEDAINGESEPTG
jgi:hypothetical protein